MKIINGESLKPNHKYFIECARIHSKEIPYGFLPTLGVDFLSSLYEVFSKSKYSFLLLAIEDSRVVGFIAVSLHTKLFFKQYLWTQSYKNLHKIPISIFGQVFIKKIVEVLKYPFESKISDGGFISNSEIFNFCVADGMQGRGVGQLIFSNAVAQLKDMGVEKLKIVTGHSQMGAQKFYYKCGATLSHKIIVHQGEESLVFNFNLTGA